MYLERLDIHGFKSFANKTTLLFEARSHTRPGITAIVGPNGSGKSNTADAIRWVLGEQSVKAVRGKKMEDVIFSGSERKARLGMAEVTMTLNNEDRKAPVDANQIAITRRVFRDGNSDYLINNAPSRLQDIQLLLAKARFGQRTYSVISQGMVDDIILISPKERKEYFDEAAGVKQYQLKRDEAVRKLTATRENLHEAELLIAEIEPRVRSLTRQVKRLERREEVEKELRSAQQAYYGALWHDCASQYKIQATHLHHANESRTKKEEEVQTIQHQLQRLEKEETQSEAFLALQKQYEALVAKRNTLRDEEFALKSALLRLDAPTKSTGAMPLAEITRSIEQLLARQHEAIEQLIAAETFDAVEKIKPLFRELNASFSAFAEKITAKTPDNDKRRKELQDKIGGIGTMLATLTDDLVNVQKHIQKQSEEEKLKKSAFFALQRQFQQRQTELHELVQKENDIRIAGARLEQRKEDLEREIQNEGIAITTLTTPSVGGETLGVEQTQQLLPEIKKLKHQLELIGGTDPESVAEYHKTKERYDFLTTQSTDLTNAMQSLEGAIQELDDTIKVQFDTAFKTINDEFQKYFRILFGGGNAKLALIKDMPPEALPAVADNAEEAEDAEKEKSQELEVRGQKLKMLKPVIIGIDIQATPPGKRLQSIGMLSGGERALTSIALICAFISNNPSPFVVLDEVDAALDEANSERFSRILDDLSGKTQFIAITHNRATMH
ncbi:AAA family ATPase, partial [Candidatus Uhrbacteria bacterium]|nr:AAA family ATPase [Candidatus Uhrbacteria bacterium]